MVDQMRSSASEDDRGVAAARSDPKAARVGQRSNVEGLMRRV